MHLKFTQALSLTVALATATAACSQDDPSASGSSAGGATAAPAPDPLSGEYDAVLDDFVNKGGVGATLYVRRGDLDPYAASRGLADVADGTKLTPDHLLRTASVAKVYIASLAVKLAAEGELDLDAAITAYLPEEITRHIEYADDITVFDMLTHQSGIYDYRDLDFTRDVLSSPGKIRDEYTDLMTALEKDPEPCSAPRPPLDSLTQETADCLYSNSNYVLTGIILDGILGAHHARALHDDLLAPLGLDATFYEKHLLEGQSIPRERLAHAYAVLPSLDGSPPAPGAEAIDVTDLDDGYGFANGGLISTAGETAIFLREVRRPDTAFPMADLESKAKFLTLLNRQGLLGLAPAGLPLDGYVIIGGEISGYVGYSAYSVENDTMIYFLSNDQKAAEVRSELVGKIQEIIKNDG